MEQPPPSYDGGEYNQPRSIDEEAALLGQQDDIEELPPRRSWLCVITTITFMGVIYGTAITKSHVWEPELIRKMFTFESSLVPKFLLSATGSSALCFVLVAMLTPATQRRFVMAREAAKELTRSRSWFALLIGAVLFGAGMATSGSSPDMLPIQLGAGLPNAWVTLFGALFGAVLYSLIEPIIDPWFLRLSGFSDSENGKCCARKFMIWPVTYADEMHRNPFWVLAISIGVLCLVAASVWEGCMYWQGELPKRLTGRVDESINAAMCSDGFNCVAWPPMVCGLLIGPCQIFAVMGLDCFLESADAYQMAASWIESPFFVFCDENARGFFRYAVSYVRPTLRVFYQLPLLIIAMIVSAIFTTTSEGFGKAMGMDTASSFLGGLMMMIGARVCGGGIATHIYTGCGTLMLYSWIFAPVVLFSGAVVAAWVGDGFTQVQLESSVDVVHSLASMS